MTAAIETQQLTKQFGAKKAVNALDLSIEAGTFFCFLGPNGAGKTTTIKMLTGLLHPSDGQALLGGFDIAKEPVEAKKLLGYVPDHPFLYDKLTGNEFMRFVAGLYQMSEADYEVRCGELLEMFEIAHVADQLVEDYSHGMHQKLFPMARLTYGAHHHDRRRCTQSGRCKGYGTPSRSGYTTPRKTVDSRRLWRGAYRHGQ